MADEPTPDAPEGGERPEWLLDRYQTAEDQAKAYAESQTEMNRMRAQMEQERNSFASALETFQQQPPAPQQQFGQQQFDPSVSAFAQAWENGDPQAALQAAAQYTMAPTVEAVGRLMDEKLSALAPAVQAATVAQRELDIRMAEGVVERIVGQETYSQIMPRVKEIINENPQRWLPQGSSVESYAASIMEAIKLADHDRLAQVERDWAQERADKLGAQTLQGGWERPVANPDYAKSEFDRIKSVETGTFSEMVARSQRGA